VSTAGDGTVSQGQPALDVEDQSTDRLTLSLTSGVGVDDRVWLSLTRVVDDHVLLSRTSVGVDDRMWLSLTSVVDDHVLLSLTSDVGVDDRVR